VTESRQDGLVGDALPLEIIGIDGQSATFIWYYLGGVDRLTVVADGQRMGVIEQLDSKQPRLIPDHGWSAWFEDAQRSDRFVAQAKRQWDRRGEIVADRALREGGQQ
jgi:hypothetical protein